MNTKKMFFLLLISVFLITLSNEILNMGLLLWASLQAEDPIKQAALVGFWASLGYIVAIFIGKYTFKLSLKILLLLTFLISIPVFFLKPMSLVWGVFLLARSMLGQVTYARLVTLLPQLCDTKDLTANNKKIQLAISSAGVATMIASPLLAKINNIVWVIGISIVIFVWAAVVANAINESKRIQDSEFKSNAIVDIFKDISNASLMFYLTWVVYGTFFIIEVPLLKNALGASAFTITLFLATGMLTNLITTKIISPKMIDKNGALLFSISCLGLVSFSYAYINSHVFLTLYLSAFILGIWNALMNITIYTQVQYLKNDFIRENRYILYRLICEIGIFSGILFVYLIHVYNLNFSRSMTAISIVVFICLLFLTFSCRFNPFQVEFANVDKN
jgi:hypothetical protein